MIAARAGGITAAGLIAGAAIGSALQSWLRVDIVPIGVRFVAPSCTGLHDLILHDCEPSWHSLVCSFCLVRSTIDGQ